MKILIVVLVFLLSGCFIGDSKFIRKKISTDDITIRWYYYSYISSDSPDIIEVEQNGKSKQLLKADWAIIDVALKDHNILVKLASPMGRNYHTDSLPDVIFGYNVILDTTGLPSALNFIPMGEKE